MKSHLSSSTNVENFTSNFGQSVQICCREKEKEENNGNCKAFSVIHKHKKSIETKLRYNNKKLSIMIVYEMNNKFTYLNISCKI